MKKTLLLLAAAAILSACSAPKKQSRTVTGTIIDASMNNVMIKTAQGDSLSISTMDVQGLPAILLNDSVEIVYTDTLDYRIAKSMAILKQSPYGLITGSWVEPNPIDSTKVQGFTLSQSGTATMIDMATLVFKAWNMPTIDSLNLTGESIGNKLTIKINETYKINKLTADSLILSQDGTSVFKLARHK